MRAHIHTDTETVSDLPIVWVVPTPFLRYVGLLVHAKGLQTGKGQILQICKYLFYKKVVTRSKGHSIDHNSEAPKSTVRRGLRDCRLQLVLVVRMRVRLSRATAGHRILKALKVRVHMLKLGLSMLIISLEAGSSKPASGSGRAAWCSRDWARCILRIVLIKRDHFRTGTKYHKPERRIWCCKLRDESHHTHTQRHAPTLRNKNKVLAPFSSGSHLPCA